MKRNDFLKKGFGFLSVLLIPKKDRYRENITLIDRIVVNNVHELRKALPSYNRIQAVLMLGYYKENDSGGGIFYWDPKNNNNDDGGCIINPYGQRVSKSGRWIRLLPNNSVTPKMYGAYGDGKYDDTNALSNCDNYATDKNISIDGNGLHYAIKDLTLKCGDFRNINFVPVSNYKGPGPWFIVNQFGIVRHENISVVNFKNGGTSIKRGNFLGTPSFIVIGPCNYSNNGEKIQTTTTKLIDTKTDYLIPVKDTSIFHIDDEIWIGDGKYKIFQIIKNNIIISNNRKSPILLKGSQAIQPIGQFVTLDKNGRNGITIGDGKGAFNIDTINGHIVANNNGWFGLFHWTKEHDGIQNVSGCTANDNGFIGLGLGYTNKGTVSYNEVMRNGNNGLDIFESTSSTRVVNNVSKSNGVDGIFVGGDKGIAEIKDNISNSNHRIGILIYGRKNSPTNLVCSGNNCVDNFFRSISLTGIRNGSIANCRVGRATIGVSIYIEGKNNQLNPSGISISNNIFYKSSSGESDIMANVGGYSNSGKKGYIELKNNNFIDHKSRIKIMNAAKNKM